MQGIEEGQGYGTPPRSPTRMWPGQPGLSIHFFQLYPFLFVFNQGPLSDPVSCLPCPITCPALPFWPGGSSPDLCICARVWFMCPAVPVTTSPVSTSAPASAHCIQLQVLLPSSLVTLWLSLMNKTPAPMGEDQQNFKHLRSLHLRHLRVLPSLPLTSRLLKLRSDGEG